MTRPLGATFAERLRHRVDPAWNRQAQLRFGVYNDGFIHAGNLAYLALLAMFPFFIWRRPSPSCSASRRGRQR